MQLPPPDEAAAATSARLVRLIATAVEEAGGFLPFDRYMELALYAPGLGYYAGGSAKIGSAGDFVTAPSMSRLFGRCLARQVGEVLVASAPQVLEFGAGTGDLAADLLLELGDACAGYAIVELSPDLIERQRTTLAKRAPEMLERVRWLDRLPDSFRGCVVANEVLDAMPVKLIETRAGGLLERGVALDAGGRFCYATRRADATLAAAASGLELPPDGYQSEIGLAARAWTTSLGDWLAQGAALLVDYGFARSEFYHPQRARGTLMCHYRHRAHDDPFLWPGLADITAHVDFSAIVDAGMAAGLECLGYASQATFLINCGITDLLASTSPADATRYLPQANQVQRLISPAEMGDLFKVLALGRGIDPALCGFARGDRSHVL